MSPAAATVAFFREGKGEIFCLTTFLWGLGDLHNAGDVVAGLVMSVSHIQE